MPRNTGGGRNNARKEKPANDGGKKKKGGWTREFLDGFHVYSPREHAPNFVVADICLDVDKLTDALNAKTDDKLYGQICESKEGKFYFMLNVKADDSEVPF